MNLDQLIVDLLQGNKNVIVPGLGSFIKSEGTTSYTILFNQFLKYNDKLLQTKIQSTSNCSEQDALDIIQNYTNSILSQLEVEGNYLIPGLGILLTKSGKIDFQHTTEMTSEIPSEENSLDENITEAANQESSKAPQINSDSNKQDEKEIEPVIQTESNNAKQNSIDSNQTEEIIDNTEPSALNKEKPQGEKANIPPNENNKEDESKKEENLAVKHSTEDKVVSPSSKPKKKKGLLWVGTFLIFSGIALLCWLRWDGIMSLINSSEQKLAEHSAEELPVLDTVYKKNRIEDTTKTMSNTIAPVTTQIDTTMEPTIDLDTIDTNPSIKMNDVIEPPVPAVSLPTSKLYHIIGGSFSKESNAINLVGTLNQKGYSKALIIGKRNEMFTVSYGGYSSKKEAKIKADKIINSGENEGVWILFY